MDPIAAAGQNPAPADPQAQEAAGESFAQTMMMTLFKEVFSTAQENAN